MSNEYLRIGEAEITLSSDRGYSVVIPIALRRRGARKAVILPNGEGWAPTSWNDAPTPLQLTLARGTRWIDRLASGEVDSITALSKLEGVERATMSRCLTLTTLAPEVVHAILEETLPPELTLMELSTGTPMDWQEQRKRFLKR
ncbi:LacI family transcriptional regulator [Luteimonas panaciterrae]|uniref:LacI family transcriptional regulator n=1 Tax=Luteimonas panaciterrae TaxID=363885 RepID=UPI001CFAB78D|nr:LacI family transcriptional regulator [Luteimonas panaciterrae]